VKDKTCDLMRTTRVPLVAGVVSALASYVGPGGLGVAHADDRAHIDDRTRTNDGAASPDDRGRDSGRDDYDPWSVPETDRVPVPNMPDPNMVPGYGLPDVPTWQQVYPTAVTAKPHDHGFYPRIIRDRPGILPGGVVRLGADGGGDSDGRLIDQMSASLGLGHEVELGVGDRMSLSGPDLQTPSVALGYALVDSVHAKLIPRTGVTFYSLPAQSFVRFDAGVDAELELSPSLAIMLPAHQIQMDTSGMGAATTLALPVAAELRLRPTLALHLQLTAIRLRADAPNDWHGSSLLMDATPFAVAATWSACHRVDVLGLVQRDLSGPGVTPTTDTLTALVGLRFYGLL
jgi:hypothetical protein